MKKNIKLKRRRRKRKSTKSFTKNLRFLGVNAAGINPKLTTFQKVLSDLDPSVFFIEETKYKESGKLKADNFVVFERVRENGVGGGGVAIGCVKDLHPALIREGTNDVETLSVDIFLKNMKIRCCVGYGPQENDLIEKKNAFWEFLDEEVFDAKKAGAAFILHCDGNLWAGSGIIPGDPRAQNRNGKFFQEFLERNNLTVVNSLPLCEGLITRRRLKNEVLEESILDFFVVCSSVLPYVTRMVIDETKNHILTNYHPAKTSGKAVDSDHMTEYMDVNLKFSKVRPERQEMFNFKDKEGLNKFKILTSETREFSECFNKNAPLTTQVENWRKVLGLKCKKSFKKIRIKSKGKKPVNKTVANLIDKRNKLTQEDQNNQLDELDKAIANLEAEEIRDEIMKKFKYYSDNPENIDMNKMWKLLKKVSPKMIPTLPTAKRNHKGRIISGPEEIKKLLAKEYKNRLRKRPVRPDLLMMKSRKKKLFEMKMKIAELRKGPKWTMKDLDRALADLKNDKSRDAEGYANEIFKNGVIGDDLKLSLITMFNRLREENLIPIFLNFSNITTVPKRGSRLDPENERGIFRVSVIRGILMRIIYNEKYPIIDRNMSDCQMGGRKGKGCKSNVWIINGIIHEVLKSTRMKPIQLQIYDYKQMFDSMDLEEAICDIFDVGVDDDSLVLIYKANKEIKMSVKTTSGLTERQTLEDIVLQGDTFGSILASVQVDAIGKDVEEAGLGYLYKNTLPISMLGLVDDIIGVTEAGFKAAQMNSIINVKTAEKCLQFGVSKCKSMFIGKKKEHFLDRELFVDKWKVEYKDNLETNEEELVETYEGLTPIGRTSEQKYLGFVISANGDNMANINAVKKKSIGIIRKIMTKLESLHLKNYFFECALIFLKVMLRASILYSCETYYNLSEVQIRQIERIEEGFLRKILNTQRGCPIVQLYLEVGLVPARFEIQRLRLLYLKTILQQSVTSMAYRFFYLQIDQPTRGDWASTCLSDLKELRIEESFEEIKQMTKSKYNNMLKQRINENAIKYLTEKQGKKGKEMNYSNITMAEYLLPNNNLSNLDKQRIFAIRNKMVEIENNFPSGNKETYCYCGEKEKMSHIYYCELLSENRKVNVEYDKIYEDNVIQQVQVYKRFEENFKTRENIMNVSKRNIQSKKIQDVIKRKAPGDPLVDPLDCKLFSIG